MAASAIRLADLSATVALGRRLGARLHAGDAVLLTGDLGAGKTELARSMIRARFGTDKAGHGIEVPSPTFNLVIPYELGDITITHFDLYRLEGPDDVVELGLDEALDDGAIIVEWPDRLGDLTPANALEIHLTQDGDARQATFTASPEMMERFLGD
ncbi:MAG: tRNA (adenosine(37)-N6)-threonylcarbamoyltransferase complex ATPase subunit type 1 TsaE [Minwuia sp.]|nr:tRNA (adenosine(37)-N6)-threonylcarbamoyltransferase complex ATPase subunit type 1 TsaE [Minwuia sp.]